MLTKTQIVWLKVLILLGGLYVLAQVTPIYLPVILAVILTFILNPLVNIFCSVPIWPFKTCMSRGIAVLLSFLCCALLFSLISSFVLLPFISEFEKFIVNLPALVTRVKDIAMAMQERASLVEIPGNIQNIIEKTLSSVASFSVDLARGMINTSFGFASRAVELVVVPILTFYFLRDWRPLKNDLLTIFPQDVQEKAGQIIEEMALVISHYIRGQALISVIIGLMVFTGMYLLGVDYPLVLGLLATMTETIPIIGPIIGSVPAILLAYLAAPELALKVTLFYLIVHQIENHIIVPNIMGHNIDLHPVSIILSLLIGSQLLGIAGMILAVPVAALLKVLLKHVWQE